MTILRQPVVVLFIWGFLLVEIAAALWTGSWRPAFIALATLVLSMAPATLARWFHLELPRGFVVAIVAFIFCTIFLGEVSDFYEKYWWWDIALHGGSAVGFGMVGFLFVFYLFEGDRYAAPPLAVAFIAFCFAITIGSLWEIFEFAMDQLFGFNMQKSGLVDTMTDLIVNVVGASIGAGIGYIYLIGRGVGPAWMIEQFVRLNAKLFRKLK